MKKILVLLVGILGLLVPFQPAGADFTEVEDVYGPEGVFCELVISQSHKFYFTGTPVRNSQVTNEGCYHPTLSFSTTNDYFYVKQTVRVVKAGQPDFFYFPANNYFGYGTITYNLTTNLTAYNSGKYSTLVAVCDNRPEPDFCYYPVEIFAP